MKLVLVKKSLGKMFKKNRLIRLSEYLCEHRCYIIVGSI